MKQSVLKQERAERYSDTEISYRTYNLVIGFVILSGIILNIVMAATLMEPILSMSATALGVIDLVGSLGFYLITRLSRNPMVSYAAFLGMSCVFGLTITWSIAGFDVGTVLIAFIMTGLVTAIMLVLSAAFPEFFLSLGKVLFITLLCSVAVDLIFYFVLGFDLTILDFAFVLIFSGYIGYDWAKAQQYPRTYDNAVDSAADIYWDIVLLFLNLLSIFGGADD